MISAVSKHGAASSAKRIISTAPMAKFGAITQLLVVNAVARSRCEVVVGEAGGADHRVHAVARRTRRRFSRAASSWVKSTTTSGSVWASASASASIVQVQVEAGDLPQVEARVVRVGRGDQLEVGVGGHRPADGAAHPAACAEHADPQRHQSSSRRRPGHRRRAAPAEPERVGTAGASACRRPATSAVGRRSGRLGRRRRPRPTAGPAVVAARRRRGRRWRLRHRWAAGGGGVVGLLGR